MHLWTVAVVDRVTGRKTANTKIGVSRHATVAATAREAAENVARENAILPTDEVIVARHTGLTVTIGRSSYYPREIESRLPTEAVSFSGSDMPAREV